MKRLALILSCAALVFSLGILSSCTPGDGDGDDSTTAKPWSENQNGIENSANNTVDKLPDNWATER